MKKLKIASSAFSMGFLETAKKSAIKEGFDPKSLKVFDQDTAFSLGLIKSPKNKAPILIFGKMK